jgi:hypothetical protein
VGGEISLVALGVRLELKQRLPLRIQPVLAVVHKSVTDLLHVNKD